jgi:hypothetical protein
MVLENAHGRGTHIQQMLIIARGISHAASGRVLADDPVDRATIELRKQLPERRGSRRPSTDHCDISHKAILEWEHCPRGLPVADHYALRPLERNPG